MLPSVYASVFAPDPPAIVYLSDAAIQSPLSFKIDVPIPVHDIPFVEYAIVFVPTPTATHDVPFHATSFPIDENTDCVTGYQLIPFDEYAIVFPVVGPVLWK